MPRNPQRANSEIRLWGRADAIRFYPQLKPSDAIATLTVVRGKTKLGKPVVDNWPVNAIGQRL
jgi:hypothetical protein